MSARSLRRDLTLGLSLGLTVLWVIAMLGAALIVREELAEIYDSLMEETANRLLPMDASTTGSPPPPLAEALLIWVRRDADGAIIARSPGARDEVFATPAPDGFSTIGDFRHFVRGDGESRLDIASPLAERREAAQGVLLALLVPMLILLPLCLFGIAWFMRRNLRSLDALSVEVAGRAPDDLHPLATPGLKAELLPIRDAVDRLMAKLGGALDAERAFSANAAHELRTPIAAVLAHVQRLMSETPPGPAMDRARMVEGELKRVTRLVEKLLQLARAENGAGPPATPVDAVRILRLVALDFDVATDLPEAQVLVRMDADALAMLARNLIENAAIHGHDARVSLTPDGVLGVTNAGPAVAPDMLPRLTQRFERAQSRKDGSGLGLAIVLAICRTNGLVPQLHSPARGRADGFEACVALPLAQSQSLPPSLPG